MTTYRGQLTGQTFDSIEALRHFEARELQRRSVRTPEEEAFDNLPAEKIREHFERLSADERTKAAQQQTIVDLGVFKELHPEFKNSDLNRAAMLLALRASGANVDLNIANLEQLEIAWEYCIANGSADIDEKAVRKQEKDRIQNWAAQVREQRERTASFDPNEDYQELSTDELRQRANDQLSGGSRAEAGGMGAEYEVTVKPFGSISHALDDPSRRLTPGSSLNTRGWSESRSRF